MTSATAFLHLEPGRLDTFAVQFQLHGRDVRDRDLGAEPCQLDREPPRPRADVEDAVAGAYEPLQVVPATAKLTSPGATVLEVASIRGRRTRRRTRLRPARRSSSSRQHFFEILVVAAAQAHRARAPRRARVRAPAHARARAPG